MSSYWKNNERYIIISFQMLVICLVLFLRNIRVGQNTPKKILFKKTGM